MWVSVGYPTEAIRFPARTCWLCPALQSLIWATTPFPSSPWSVSLSHLGDFTMAMTVTLLRAESSGCFGQWPDSSRCLEWTQGQGEHEGTHSHCPFLASDELQLTCFLSQKWCLCIYSYFPPVSLSNDFLNPQQFSSSTTSQSNEPHCLTVLCG